VPAWPLVAYGCPVLGHREERVPLDQVELSGARRRVRQCLLYGLVLSGVVATLTYFLPGHRVIIEGPARHGTRTPTDLPLHSVADDLGAIWVLGFAAAIVTSLVAAHGAKRLPVPALAGLFAILFGVITLVAGFLAHTLSTLETVGAGVVLRNAQIAMVTLGAVVIVADPVLRVLERRRHRRQSSVPDLPAARVHRGD